MASYWDPFSWNWESPLRYVLQYPLQKVKESEGGNGYSNYQRLTHRENYILPRELNLLFLILLSILCSVLKSFSAEELLKNVKT